MSDSGDGGHHHGVAAGAHGLGKFLYEGLHGVEAACRKASHAVDLAGVGNQFVD